MRSLGEKKPLQTSSGNINWHGHWRNQDSGSLKTENILRESCTSQFITTVKLQSQCRCPSTKTAREVWGMDIIHHLRLASHQGWNSAVCRKMAATREVSVG